MPSTPRRFTAAISLTLLTMLVTAGSGLAATQQPAAVERAATPRATQAPVPTVVASDQDASETRARFEEVLKRLPPAVGRVMRTDPSLMRNEAYLNTYPALANFLIQHPEIRNDPGFFLEHVRGSEFYSPPIESDAVRVWRDILQFIAVSVVFGSIAGVLIWIFRTILEYRRWTRTTRAQADVNNKLLDRFTNNEDLLAYIQTPIGRKLVEGAPLAIDTPARQIGAPFSRILWSVQVGVVLGAGAIGLLYTSNRVIEEVAQPLFAIGILGFALGAGFIVSALASYVLSRQLGLFQTPPAAANRLTED